MSLETTVHFVDAMRLHMQPSRPRRVPRGKPSLLPEAHYASKLVAWISELRAELAPLPRLLSEPRWDAVRTDESNHGRRVRQITEPVRRKVERDQLRLEPEITAAGRSAAAAQRQVLDRQTKAALGVEVPTKDLQVHGQIDRFVSKNLTRIRGIGDKLIGEIESIVIDAWDQGQSETEVAAAIEKRLGVAETYARFLARDQMGALYAQVTRARHDELGVRLFRWWTQGDGRVRSSHRVKHGRVFPYEGSRAPSFFPGDDYGCRCYEEPVFDEIKAKVFGGQNRRRADVRLDAARDLMRSAIVGGPRCGKTTFAATLGEARHTDDLIGLGWSEASEAAATWFEDPGPWIIEGVAVPRALRKWLASHPEGKPCDIVYTFFTPHVPLTPGQESMFKGCLKVWGEVVDELRRRGVEVRAA